MDRCGWSGALLRPSAPPDRRESLLSLQKPEDVRPAEAQIEYLPRNEDAVRWEATNSRLTTTFESRTAAAIVVSAINVPAIDLRVGALRHIYKIVCRARFLENGINVTQGW